MRGAAALFDPAMVKQDDAIGDGQRLALVVGDKDKRDANVTLQELQLALHFQAQVCIERRQRFIQQQQPGPIDQGPRQRDALLLSSADLPGEVAGKPVHADLCQRLLNTRSHLTARATTHPQAVRDVVENAHVGKQRVTLEYSMDRTAMRRQSIEPLIVEQNASGGRLLKPSQDAQQRSLAGSAFAQQGENSPCSTSSEMDSSTVCSPNRLPTPSSRRKLLTGWPLLRSISRCIWRAAAHPARRRSAADTHRYHPGAGYGAALGSSRRRLAGWPGYIP